MSSAFDNHYIKSIPNILAYVSGDDTEPNVELIRLGDLIEVSFPQLSLLTATTTITDDDLFLVADAPAGVETDKKVTASNLRTYMLNPTITVTAANAAVVMRGEDSISLNIVTTSRIKADATGLGFFNHATAAQPTVTGSAGANAALISLLTGLAGLGLIVDSSS